ncbi:hypothetical protein HNQ88_004521 [Aureibacter tunicatorum]|uniref:Uncharacterized protein n=1 Tax=Aureibacter tunicatorum TaxID=866807 RepID=A0AAE4BSP4_9BACT|nr:hypothetical protein [Aureibacter tunicatorum]BDD06721.1 hypothetical protein AUTU_42040 [Aureibacter tunicatorum]
MIRSVAIFLIFEYVLNYRFKITKADLGVTTELN